MSRHEHRRATIAPASLVATVALTLTILTTLATRASARGLPPVRADSTVKFVGLWEGSYHSDHGPAGGYRLEIAHDTGWAVKVDIVAEHPITSVVKDFRATGDRITWTQEIVEMGLTCQSSATLEQGKLRGATDCGHVALTFELHKSKP
jgi:hypothetical protein